MFEFEIPSEIEEYRLIRVLGSGSMGRVYLAEDRLLERLVAIKFIAGIPSATSRDRFFTEARAAARISHSNVVTIHRVAEFKRQPFLVAEYVRGQNLGELTRPMESEQVRRIGLDLARGLAAAHRRGVLHRDIKPANAMVSEEGITKLLDFGLAQLVNEGDVAKSLAGTPIYMAPELWTGAAPSPRTDIFALGVLLFELESASHPFDRKHGNKRDDRGPTLDSLVPEPDRALCKIIERCIEFDPLGRFASADALVEALEMLTRTVAPSVRAPSGSPYRGLLAFGAEHRDLFFGRRAEALTIHDRLLAERFLVVVGDSGTGKSSLCRAGVLPLFEPNADTPSVVLGHSPISTLASVLGALAGLAESDCARLLLEEPSAVSRLLRGRGRETILFVDQLEELLTQASLEDASLVSEALAALVRTDGIRLLATARSDFLTRMTALPGLGDDLTRALWLLPPLGQERLFEVVTQPAATKGVSFESDAMVRTLIEETHVAEGGLPLLQFALGELWELRDQSRSVIPTDALTKIGGVGGALARHADNVVGALPGPERSAARAVILALVTSDDTRDRKSRSVLIQVANRHTPRAEIVLETLVRGRLLTTRDSESGEVLYTVAHEALLTSWQQFANWVQESREERRLLSELETAAIHWARRGERREETWSHDELVATRRRVTQLGIHLPPGSEAFLHAGEARHRTATRRRRLAGGVTIAVLSISTAAAASAISHYLDREHRIRSNLGTVDLTLDVIDVVDGNPKPVPRSEIPDLSWRAWETSADDPDVPSKLLPQELVHVIRLDSGAERVSVPGGVVFLEIMHRGRRSETCNSSWIRIRAFPGYRESDLIPRMRLVVPSCQATFAGMVEIPKGPFIYGGPGDKPLPLFEHDSDYTEPEKTIDEPAFWMDRTEVSNGAFATFATMERITGYPKPVYSTDEMHKHDRDPEYPVAEVDSTQARAYCKYLGKKLPSEHQWVKAARGGLTVDGEPNPAPRRLYPWGTTFKPECVNEWGENLDQFEWVAPVTALACGQSPYKILNLVGNVQEWIDRDGQSDRDSTGLYALRGGAADSPPEQSQTNTIWRNHRDPRRFDYSVGVRCAYEDKP